MRPPCVGMPAFSIRRLAYAARRPAGTCRDLVLRTDGLGLVDRSSVSSTDDPGFSSAILRVVDGPSRDELHRRGVSDRELEVLDALAERLSNAEIARHLCVSERTIESHVSSLLRKLEARDRVDVLRWSNGSSSRRTPTPRLPHRLQAMTERGPPRVVGASCSGWRSAGNAQAIRRRLPSSEAKPESASPDWCRSSRSTCSRGAPWLHSASALMDRNDRTSRSRNGSQTTRPPSPTASFGDLSERGQRRWLASCPSCRLASTWVRSSPSSQSASALLSRRRCTTTWRSEPVSIRW